MQGLHSLQAGLQAGRTAASPQRSSLDNAAHMRIANAKSATPRPRSASSSGSHDDFMGRFGSAPGSQLRGDSSSQSTFLPGSSGADCRSAATARVLRVPEPRATSVGFTCGASSASGEVGPSVPAARASGLLHRSLLNDTVFTFTNDGGELDVHSLNAARKARRSQL